MAHPSTSLPKETLRRRIDAAMGRRDCDLILRGVRYLDVFAACFREADIAIADGVIVGVEPGRRARREVDARGKHVVPGFIDAHVHLESSMMLPAAFESAVLKHGTTAAVCDPHELANVVGLRGIRYFLDAADALALDLRVMLSPCVPATHLETNGGGVINAAQLLTLAGHPRALGVAEMMNFPGVLNANDDVLEKIAAFANVPIDGHCPLLRGSDLSAYAAAGICSCHESSQLDEAEEKLTRGIAVWIREGSVAKDLEALAPLLTMARSPSIGFCTDDRNPFDIAAEGHLDHIMRRAIALGGAPEVVYRMASWSVARHYGLDRGPQRTGAIAPGYQADLVVLDDLTTCAIHAVYKSGKRADEIAPAVVPDAALTETIQASVPEEAELEGPRGRVHVIGVIPGKLITEHHVLAHDAPSVRRLSVLERYGHGEKPANGYVTGFGALKGAIASSVGHDSHNLIVVGEHPREMRLALAALIESGGGFAVALDNRVIAHVALPHAGLMTSSSPEELAAALSDLKAAGRAAGCELEEPFLQLAFLSLPVIPSLKLTNRGLVDVERFELIDVRAA